MENLHSIKELVTYNLWANKRLIAWLASNDQELITQTCSSSFPSILKTVRHILEGQLFYYTALNEVPYDNPWDDTIQGNYNGLLAQSKAFLNYVKSQQTFNEHREVSIKNVKGKFLQHELITHCMNHSTYHRGQIITMGHQLGLTKAPSTDLLFYYIKREQQL